MSQAAVRHPHSTTGRAFPRVASLRVVPAAIERTGTGKFAAICMLLLAGGLLGLLLFNAQLAQGSYRLHDLQVASGTLTDQEHELTRALDAERNPGALAKKAIALGMVPATSMAFIDLEHGRVLGVAEPAVARTVTIVSSPRGNAPAPSTVTPGQTASPGQTATPAAPVDAAGADPEAAAGGSPVTPATGPQTTANATTTVPGG